MTRKTGPTPRAPSRAEIFKRFQRHALCPKPTTDPSALGVDHAVKSMQLSWLTGQLGPPERRAMREIAERADLLEVDGRTYLLVPIGAETLEALAAFEAEGDDDLHPDHDIDGCQTEYGELDESDFEADADREDGAAGPSPATIARKHAIIAERRAAERVGSRHRVVATDPDGTEWIFVTPGYPAADAMP